MNAELIQAVWHRAASRCEYCHFPATGRGLCLQVDHIIARQHGGLTESENLALACIHCNRFKGPNIAGFDLDLRQVVRLFDPRRDIWAEHFAWDGAELHALTAIGRVTISVLFINDPDLTLLREALRSEDVIL